MTLHLFYGQEDFLIEKDIEKLKNKLLNKNFLSISLKTYSNPKFPELIDILSTPLMMFGNSLIIIDCPEYFTSQFFEDKQFKQIEQALSSVPPQINIIFRYRLKRNTKDKIDSRKKIFKLLSKYCEVKEYNAFRDFDKPLPAVIIKLGKEHGLELTPKCISKIIELCGTNLRLIDSELQKLKLYIHPKTQPAAEDVENICSRVENVFNLADLFIKSDNDNALKEFDQITKAQHPLVTMAMLQTTIDKYIKMKLLSRTMPLKDIAAAMGLNE